MQSQECGPELFSRILDNCLNLVAVVDHQGLIHYANPRAQELGQKVGNHAADWVPADDRSSIVTALETTTRTGEPSSYEIWLESSGNRRLYSGRLAALGDGLFSHFVDDVTEQKQATIAQDATAEQYQAVFHATNDALIIMHQNGTLTDVNRAACEMHGFTREEFLKLSPSDFIHPDSIPEFVAYAEALRRGDTYFCEAMDLRKDGTAFEIEVQGFPFRYQGEPQMLGVIKEVSQRKRAERELRESEARKATMIKSALDGIVTLDETGSIREINPAAEKVFEVEQDVRGRLFTDILGPEEFAGRLQASIRDADTTADLFGQQHECKAITSRGRVVPIELSVTPLKMPDQLEYMIFLRNITERKRLSAQLQQSQKMEVLGQLTGGVAHDFNNLLTAMVGNLALIEELCDQPERVKSLAARAMASTDRASDLTHRLLAFSRKQPLRPTAISLQALITGIEDLVRRSLGDGVELVTEIDDELWSCEVDPSQLESALLNLALNSRDAMPDGGTVTVSASNVELDPSEAKSNELPSGDYVLLAVNDTGQGIAREVLPHVFDPFFSTKEMGKGSGLGLSMVYGFVKQSKGMIKISSELGEGTTISIYLPRAEVVPQNPRPRPSVAIPRGHGELILVVEDDEAVRFVTVNLLLGLGYKTLEASNAPQALRLLDQHQVGLLLTDVVLGAGMNGAQLAELAVRSAPHRPVLFTSGYTADALGQPGQLAPEVKLLEKPFSREQLALQVREALDS